MKFDAWTVFIDFSVMATLLLIGQVARAKIRIIQSLFLPAALIAGLLGLLLGPNGYQLLPLSPNIAVYPGILIILVFAALPLGKESRPFKAASEGIGNMWAYSELVFVAQHALAMLIGLFVLVPLFNVPAGFGFMLPAGFVGGHGTAAAVGATFASYGWNEALTLGMTSATVGILTGVIGGVALINYGTKKGYTRCIQSFGQLPPELRTGLVEPGKANALGKETVSPISLDPLAFHLALVLLASLAGYYVTQWAKLIHPKLSLPTFAVAMVCGAILQRLLRGAGADRYVDGRVTTRISSACTDLLVAFGVASIKIPLVLKYALPLSVLFAAGIAYCFFMVLFVGPRMYKEYWFEKSMYTFGWSTGVTAIGITLLRIVDPEFKTKTLDDFAIAYIPMSFVEMSVVALAPIAIATGFAWHYTGVICAATLGVILIAWRMRWFYRHGALRTGDSGRTLAE